MLSNPTCTNQTGIHQRQNSTPTDPKANLGSVLPASETSITPNHHVSDSHGAQDRPIRNAGPQRSNDNKVDVDEQHTQHPLQTSQELTARPGSQHSHHLFQHEAPSHQQCEVALTSRQSLSDSDIDALLKGLQSNEACLNQPMPQFAGHSRLGSDFTVNFQSHDDGGRFMSLAMSNHQIEVESQPLCSQFVDSDIAKRHHNIIEASLNADDMEIMGESSTRCCQRMQAHSQADQNLSHLTKTINDSDFTGSDLPGVLEAGLPLIKEDSNTTIRASKRIVNPGHSRGNASIERYFEIQEEPTKQLGRVGRHSVDFTSSSIKDFPDLSDLKADMPLGKGGYNPAIYSPLNNSLPSNMVSLQSSPEVPSMTLFEDAEVDDVVVNAQRSFMQAVQCNVDISEPASPVRQNHHERTRSTTDLDLEDCVRDTGVTTEEIASFIQGPLPEDQKWSCLFEETRGKPCGKRFARKENAKSHVQTHLGDRQFVCSVCQTPFVRQHDLKRHFKIHTVEKAHRCPCGKDFHRHDALTRHRQRGMCVGAFGGTPKKVIKRGRPKKARPSTEERSEKAAKTRQYVMERTRPGSTYASSISGSSEYSATSPRDFDNLSVTASSPSPSHRNFDDFKFPEIHAQPLTPPTSPDRVSETLCLPPSVYQTNSPETTRQSLSPKLCSIQEMTESSVLACPSHEQSQSSPPELDISSSSPATSQIFDFSTFSEATNSQDQYMKAFDPQQPQVFSQDFQLFNTVTRDTEAALKFEDFLDFSNIDSSSSDKQNLRARSGMIDTNHHSPLGEAVNHADNSYANF